MIAGDPGEDLAQYAVHRFGQQVADRQWLRERACATSAAYYRHSATREFDMIGL